MVQTLDRLAETPSQTAGPFVHIGATPSVAEIHGVYAQDLGHDPFPGVPAADRITVAGRVIDGTGEALRDVVIESWQADGAGRFSGTEAGFARIAADPGTGEWRLDTVKPGAVALADGRLQAPHVALWLVARGINTGLQTRVYFGDEANEGDPVLARAAAQGRAGTLIARPEGDGAYRFDIRLQGAGETVFLDL